VNTPAVAELVRVANDLASAGRWAEAEKAWLEVRRADPTHPVALYSLGCHALQRGEAAAARSLLETACRHAPNEPLLLLTLGVACQRLGDVDAERAAIDASLAVDPYFLPGLLAKAAWLERRGERLAAATTFRNCLKIAPPEPEWPPALRTQLLHARELAELYSREMHAHLERRVAELQSKLPGRLANRWREAASIMAGRTPPYRSESNQLYVPRLPAIPFFERELFPWVPALEAQTDSIRAELLAVMEQDRDRFAPYIAYNPGEPVNQWQELNQSLRWSTFHLWRAGRPVDENLARCPSTAAALASVEMAEIGGLCPNAMFSVLAPKTTIPPHNGETNARLVAHLPLIVPENCSYRVGFDWTKWTEGRVLVFDDTLEHEARNDSEQTRVVLIFDVWNPLLEPDERRMVNELAAAAREFTL
jgi:aspartyl/asparaginyl beta-hydroxylase (cupin superfamily)